MENLYHQLIADLGVKYADGMAGAEKDGAFDRRCIATAYIIGGEATLKRVCDYIRQMNVMSIIDSNLCKSMLGCIERLESMSAQAAGMSK